MNALSQYKPMPTIPNALAGNIDIMHRPRAVGPDGSVSTVRSMSINVDGLEYLLPTVSEDGRIMSNEEAIQTFFQTKRHLGAFRTVQEANAYADRLHRQQEQLYLAKTENQR